MHPPVEHPTIEIDDRLETTERHPAYAMISAHRVSGHAALYGSDFSHHHFVRIRIAPGYLRRNLSTDWPQASVRNYIEVDLSEAQWATLVSSMNIGDGVQCTLRSINGEMVPHLPSPASREDQFKREAIQRCEKAISTLDELQSKIAASGLSQKAKAALASQVDIARTAMTGGLPFVLEMFGEHMEKTVEKAKAEVNAYVAHSVARAGLSALRAGDEAPVLSLEIKPREGA